MQVFDQLTVREKIELGSQKKAILSKSISMALELKGRMITKYPQHGEAKMSVSAPLLSLVHGRIGLNEYQNYAKRTDQNQNDGLQGLHFALLGLFGEVGTLLSALKKVMRDGESYVGYGEAVIEEFGDVLWYFSNIASRASLNLSLLTQRVFSDTHETDKVEDHPFETFGDIQSQKVGSVAKSETFEKALIVLSGKVGLLMNDFSLGKISTNRHLLSEHLVEIFRALIEAADVADVSLENAAIKNLLKIESRWPQERKFTPLFDEGVNIHEQIPRKLEIHLYEIEIGGRTRVIQKWNGVNIGDSLTDNKVKKDDYRFHDIFHLSYAAILGWSPILRRSLKVKRKSDPKIDETQDGARAAFIEEGLSALIFQRAVQLDNFRSIQSLDYSLLKLIPEIVRGYEVEVCPLWQWEKAILDGFAVFRKLQEKRRGIVTADLGNRSISFSDLTSGETIAP